ncbi:MAG: hypothetical protein MO852_00300 [Candidatus Devosia euplotis]|nr:hypothetical protein [Candidatus Devosia euplotis]
MRRHEACQMGLVMARHINSHGGQIWINQINAQADDDITNFHLKPPVIQCGHIGRTL